MLGPRVLAVFVALIAAFAPAAASAADPDAVGQPPAAPASPVAPDAASPDAARSPAPPFLEGDEVIVSAERLERSGKNRIVTGEGVVTLRHREVRLVADRVVYNEQTKDIVADGNVVLDHGSDRIQGSHLELNLETRVGFMEHAQGFIQTYYFSGDRIEKRGPDHYYLASGSFTTCEGVLPDWSFRTTSADVTVDEYMHVWNPTLKVKRLPVFYFPYAVFPVKRDRATGLLIPTVGLRQTDGFTMHNAFFWAPLDNFDATIGLDYLQNTGWGASGELRYLLAARTQGTAETYYLRNTYADAERWSISTRNSHELPLGIQVEAEAFIQSDREFIGEQGETIEERSSERTSSSIYLSRSWSAWTFALSGRTEESLLTEERTTLTRFPELTVDRTSTRVFGTDLFLKIAASGVRLASGGSESSFDTTRLHFSPEMTRPLSLGSVARVIPTAGYALTRYSQDTEGNEQTRALPYYRVGLEGPRPYRIWDLGEEGRIQKIKHLIEPRVTYVYTPVVNQDTLPVFDSLDRISGANKLEYSLTNTLFAKVRAGAPARAVAKDYVRVDAGADEALPFPFEGWGPARPPELPVPGGIPLQPLDTVSGEEAEAEAGARTGAGAMAVAMAGAIAGAGVGAAPQSTTQELLWIKLSQSYAIDSNVEVENLHPFTPIEWEARTRPLQGMEVWYRGNYEVYGGYIGYQNASLAWSPSTAASIHADWRTTRGSNQDFFDLGAILAIGRFGIEGRSRYNLYEETFVENRIAVKYSAQCWDVTLGYVRWTEEYQCTLNVSLKGIGTIVNFQPGSSTSL